MKDKPLQKTYQQGDVTLRRLDSMPDGEQKVIDTGRCILRHGESGHAHVVDAPSTDAELIMIGERMLLNLKTAQAVQHVLTPESCTSPLVAGEHETRVLEAGLWEVGGVREVDHFANLERQVVD